MMTKDSPARYGLVSWDIISYRPVSEFNIGKKGEHAERINFKEDIAVKTI